MKYKSCIIWSPCNFASTADSRGDGLLVMSKRVGNFRHNLAAASQKIIMMRMTSGLASSPWCVAFSSISLGDLTQWTHCLLLLEKYISSRAAAAPGHCDLNFKEIVQNYLKCLFVWSGVMLCCCFLDISGRSHAMMPTAAGKIHQQPLDMNFKQIVQNVCLFNPGVWPQPPGVSICLWSFVLWYKKINKLVVPQFKKNTWSC